jgi:hypothetical protein
MSPVLGSSGRLSARFRPTYACGAVVWLLAVSGWVPSADAGWHTGRLSTTSADTFFPRIAFDGHGNAIAAWQQEARSEPSGIAVRIRDRRGRWGRTHVSVAPNGAGLTLASLAAFGNRRILLLARQTPIGHRGTERVVVLRLSRGRWHRQVLASTPPGAAVNHFDLALAANSRGDAAAAWIAATTNGGAGPAHVATSRGGGGFSRARQVSRGNSHFTSVAINRHGALLVAWQTQHTTQARLATRDGRFGSVQSLGQTAGAPLATSAALADDGRALVGWKTTGAGTCRAGLYGFAFRPPMVRSAWSGAAPICETRPVELLPLTGEDVRVAFGPAAQGLVAVGDAGGSSEAASLLTLNRAGELTGSQAISPRGAILRDFESVGSRAAAVSILYDGVWQPPGPRAHLYVALRAGGSTFAPPQSIAPPNTESGAQARIALDHASPHAVIVWDAGRITGNISAGEWIEWAANY